MRSIIWMVSTGNWPTALSPESMMASAPSNTAVATSETSARVGIGDVVMLSSICVATTIGLPAARALRVICFCSPGDPFDRHFDAEIAAGHHEGVAGRDDGVEIVDGRRLLDLGQHGGAPVDDALGLHDVFGLLHERQRDPVGADRQVPSRGPRGPFP